MSNIVRRLKNKLNNHIHLPKTAKMLLTLAWRNIWRNKRRTLITMASIIFAVVLCVLMDSVKKGFLDKMIENMVGVYTGYVQVHQKDYWEEKTLDNSFIFQDSLVETITKNREVTAVIPRLESYALTASEDYAKGAMIVGIDPSREKLVTSIDEKLLEGKYLTDDDQAVLLTEGLANYLKLKLNDTLVLIGQGYHGVSAAGKYPIKGLIKFGSPDLNSGLVYLPLKECQRLFGAENRLTALVLQLDDIEKSESARNELAANLEDNFKPMNWKAMLPELDSFIEGETRENVVFQVILYMLIAFGIFGTILMMTLERQREFGVLVSIGMKKIRLTAMVILENIMISVLGALVGTLLSVPFVLYFYKFPIHVGGQLAEAYENFNLEPIFYFSIKPEVFYTQGLIVLCVALILSVYPMIKILALEPVKAMQS